MMREGGLSGLFGVCGHLPFGLPQVVLGHLYDERVDIWAVGVLAYELLTGGQVGEETRGTGMLS